MNKYEKVTENEVKVQEKGVLGSDPRVWEEVSGGSVDEYWKPLNAGDEVSGRLSGSAEGNYGKVWLLEVKNRVIGLPSNVVLQNTMLKVSLGEFVRVTYLGTEKSEKGNKVYKDFKVEVLRSGTPFY